MIITDRNEIDKLVEKFREILRDKPSQTYQIYAGYKGGNELITAYWSGELGYWSGFLDLEGKSWNAFGIEKPANYRNMPITVEINFPKRGINRRI